MPKIIRTVKLSCVS